MLLQPSPTWFHSSAQSKEKDYTNSREEKSACYAWKEGGVTSSLLKIWNLEKVDKKLGMGTPVLLRSVQTDNRPHSISLFSVVLSNLDSMVIGLVDSIIRQSVTPLADDTDLLYRYLDQSIFPSSTSLTSIPKPRTIHESLTEPTTGLGFREPTSLSSRTIAIFRAAASTSTSPIIHTDDQASPVSSPIEPPVDEQANKLDQIAVWNTLLELYLTLPAAEVVDAIEKSSPDVMRDKALRVLKSEKKMGMYKDVLRFWMDRDSEGNTPEASSQVVALCTVGLVKQWLMTRIKESREEIHTDQQLINSYRPETKSKLKQVEDLSESRESPGQLDLPSVHFMCDHSYHQRCLVDHETECPNYAREHGIIREIRRNNECLADQHDLFLSEVQENGFSAVAAGFSRGVLNMLLFYDIGGDAILVKKYTNISKDCRAKMMQPHTK
ncbi:hypothetical protein PILCRDRAFT_83432 [Piloderma croceum F 1598]|uniref:Uncharacterized protein n=1 Tax=Piloderma croceum (strain F 1598) TaxID=765440 RepID=A0A0C3GNR6_PILCF|nr:hypothetical protein PILCRDRAFT_83432 [Piloderma croceum F 1598]